VRLGLRPQLLLLIGVFLALAMGPLFWAATTFARVSLQRSERHAARAVAQLVCQQALASPAAIEPLCRAPVLAIRVFGHDDVLVASAGELAVNQGGSAEWVTCQNASRQARVAARPRDIAREGRRLFRLLALYMGVFGLALLVATFFAITALIVRPLEALSRAARRVAGGAREFQVPLMPARELDSLGRSLGTMTDRLLEEERELRHRIDEVRLTTERLGEAQQRLVRSERLASVGRLAAGLAHEVGNPLSALIGFQDLLIAGDLDDDERLDFLARMRRETERIHRILRDLLDFARPSAKSSDTEQEEPGDVRLAVSETLALVAPQRSWKEIRVTQQLDPDLPAVTLPRPKLMQVLLNLLMNAADAVGDGGRVHVGAVRTPSGVRISVEDDGPGLPEEVRQHLFEPFVTTKEVGKGTGLGLAVCRGLVESAGGTVVLDGSYGPGARFLIDLPAASAHPEKCVTLGPE